MRTRALTPILVLCLLVAACAPAPGRSTVRYTAEPRVVISAIAQQAPGLVPPDGYNHFSIETISESGVTLRADPVTGLSVVGFVAGIPTEPARITISTFADGLETIVAISIFPNRLDELYDKVVELLDREFGRTLSLPGGGTIEAP